MQKQLFDPNINREKKDEYWLTPPDIYQNLDMEFRFDFDPCPYPLPKDHNALEMEWGKMNYVNPPFRKSDGLGFGPTAFVRKAIAEFQKGNGSVLLLPVQSYVNLLLEAGAILRPMGRVAWLEATTGEPMKSPSPTCCFILKRYEKYKLHRKPYY